MKLNGRYGKPDVYCMKRLGETTHYMMDDYARILASRVDLLLPADNSHKGYDSAVIARFIASLKAWVITYLQRCERDSKRAYPCKLRCAWVREFGELNGNKHYHMLLLIDREVPRDTMLNTGNSAQPRGLPVGMMARAWAMMLRHTGDVANKVPFYLPGISYELDRRNNTSTDFFRSYIYRIGYLAKGYTKNHDSGERDFGCS